VIRPEEARRPLSVSELAFECVARSARPATGCGRPPRAACAPASSRCTRRPRATWPSSFSHAAPSTA